MGKRAKQIDPEQYRLRGRPPISGDKPMTQITVRLTQQQLEAIDTIIDDRHGQTERGAIIRELIERALKAWDD